MPPKHPMLKASVQKPAPRELEVLAHFACGKTRHQISTLMSISEETVKSYLERACIKLKAMNKTHAATIAIYLGLLVPYCLARANENSQKKGEILPLAPHTGAAPDQKFKVTNKKRQPETRRVESAHHEMSINQINK
jgi:DNA-binding CsgD family transcriptional regulator